MNLQEASKYIYSNLTEIYAQREAHNICALLLEHITSFSKTERLINKELQLNQLQFKQLENALKMLMKFKPIQQVVGYTWFAGNKFFVNEDVLIPRPETEELIGQIVRENKNKKLSVLDIGTGSGCIAISLKYQLPNVNITAVDISTQALKMAEKNAKSIGVSVDFIQLDFLDENTWTRLETFDIIVSNPPYIRDNEKQEMFDNVLQYEPHSALFVPNDRALIFYEKTASFAATRLNAGGMIWVEINESLGKETLEVFTGGGFKAELKKDMQQKDRIIKAYSSDNGCK